VEHCRFSFCQTQNQKLSEKQNKTDTTQSFKKTKKCKKAKTKNFAFARLPCIRLQHAVLRYYGLTRNQKRRADGQSKHLSYNNKNITT
jgi:hypothetical protein